MNLRPPTSDFRLLSADEPLLGGDEIRHAGDAHRWIPVPPRMIGVTLRQAASAGWFAGDARRKTSQQEDAEITEPTPDQMLDWVGIFVTQIDSLGSLLGERIQVTAADDDDELVITRDGEDAAIAFRNCVREGMRQWPLDSSALSAASCSSS